MSVIKATRFSTKHLFNKQCVCRRFEKLARGLDLATIVTILLKLLY